MKKIAVLASLVLALLVAVANLYWQFDQMRAETADFRRSVTSELTKLIEVVKHIPIGRPASPVPGPGEQAMDSLRRELTEEISATQRQAAFAAQRAREAVTRADRLAQQIGEERQSQHQEVVGELGRIKQAEATTTARIAGVSADIAHIKNEVASSRYELQQTVGELKRVDADLGVQSDYIATNARELRALKLLGERNYFDFHVERTGLPQKVGDVSLILKKTDPRHSKYTLEVVAADIRTEKRDKSINEPIQFYVTRARSKARLAFEIVVNEVQKDYIIGYLSTPKELMASRTD